MLCTNENRLFSFSWLSNDDGLERKKEKKCMKEMERESDDKRFRRSFGG